MQYLLLSYEILSFSAIILLIGNGMIFMCVNFCFLEMSQTVVSTVYMQFGHV